jgi:hypothetical protein
VSKNEYNEKLDLSVGFEENNGCPAALRMLIQPFERRESTTEFFPKKNSMFSKDQR